LPSDGDDRRRLARARGRLHPRVLGRAPTSSIKWCRSFSCHSGDWRAIAGLPGVRLLSHPVHL